MGDRVKLFDLVVHMHGLDSFEEESAQAVEVVLGSTSVPVLPLERIITSKKATDRPKDRAIVPELEATLKVIQAQRKQNES